MKDCGIELQVASRIAGRLGQPGFEREQRIADRNVVKEIRLPPEVNHTLPGDWIQVRIVRDMAAIVPIDKLMPENSSIGCQHGQNEETVEPNGAHGASLL